MSTNSATSPTFDTPIAGTAAPSLPSFLLHQWPPHSPYAKPIRIRLNVCLHHTPNEPPLSKKRKWSAVAVQDTRDRIPNRSRPDKPSARRHASTINNPSFFEQIPDALSSYALTPALGSDHSNTEIQFLVVVSPQATIADLKHRIIDTSQSMLRQKTKREQQLSKVLVVESNNEEDGVAKDDIPADIQAVVGGLDGKYRKSSVSELLSSALNADTLLLRNALESDLPDSLSCGDAFNDGDFVHAYVFVPCATSSPTPPEFERTACLEEEQDRSQSPCSQHKRKRRKVDLMTRGVAEIAPVDVASRVDQGDRRVVQGVFERSGGDATETRKCLTQEASRSAVIPAAEGRRMTLCDKSSDEHENETDFEADAESNKKQSEVTASIHSQSASTFAHATSNNITYSDSVSGCDQHRQTLDGIVATTGDQPSAHSTPEKACDDGDADVMMSRLKQQPSQSTVSSQLSTPFSPLTQKSENGDGEGSPVFTLPSMAPDTHSFYISKVLDDDGDKEDFAFPGGEFPNTCPPAGDQEASKSATLPRKRTVSEFLQFTSASEPVSPLSPTFSAASPVAVPTSQQRAVEKEERRSNLEDSKKDAKADGVWSPSEQSDTDVDETQSSPEAADVGFPKVDGRSGANAQVHVDVREKQGYLAGEVLSGYGPPRILRRSPVSDDDVSDDLVAGIGRIEENFVIADKENSSEDDSSSIPSSESSSGELDNKIDALSASESEKTDARRDRPRKGIQRTSSDTFPKLSSNSFTTAFKPAISTSMLSGGTNGRASWSLSSSSSSNPQKPPLVGLSQAGFSGAGGGNVRTRKKRSFASLSELANSFTHSHQGAQVQTQLSSLKTTAISRRPSQSPSRPGVRSIASGNLTESSDDMDSGNDMSGGGPYRKQSESSSTSDSDSDADVDAPVGKGTRGQTGKVLDENENAMPGRGIRYAGQTLKKRKKGSRDKNLKSKASGLAALALDGLSSFSRPLALPRPPRFRPAKEIRRQPSPPPALVGE
ncbi:hypothetical protein HK102_000391 [Quaeritorhiza haematococci]|nr:hypothetical protein HK102_000391 [Quaeritorhiza haematococci]